MSYRSSVGLVVTSKGKDFLNDLYDAIQTEEMKDAVDALLDSATYTFHEECHLWCWEDISWNMMHDDIGFIEDVILGLQQNGLSDQFYLIRIGEDIDDIEIEGTFYNNPFDMCLVRNISFIRYDMDWNES